MKTKMTHSPAPTHSPRARVRDALVETKPTGCGVSRRNCRYVADSFQDASGNRYHGNFVLPVDFSGRGQTHIDFPALAKSLRKVQRFLTALKR
jgi:hypothetical protein